MKLLNKLFTWNPSACCIDVHRHVWCINFSFFNIFPLHHDDQKPPLGLCVVTMNLPKDWFKPDETIYLNQSQKVRQRHPHRLRSHNRSPWRTNFPASLSSKSGVLNHMIQLYYSFFGSETNRKMSPPRCSAGKQSQRNLYYIGSVALSEKETKTNKPVQGISCSSEHDQDELWLNSDVLIYYNKGPVRAGKQVEVSINLRETFSGDFLIVKYDWLSFESHILDQPVWKFAVNAEFFFSLRLKVKKGLLSVQAYPQKNSHSWVVKVQNTSGPKHDTISIISHRSGTVIDGSG